MAIWSLLRKNETQTDRIRSKLKQATRKDKAFSEFGSSSHQYKMNKRLTIKELEDWQTRNRVTLPEPYAQYLTKVGNGGAGPFYGIASIEKATSRTGNQALLAKSVQCPAMTKTEWGRLMERLTGDS